MTTKRIVVISAGLSHAELHPAARRPARRRRGAHPARAGVEVEVQTFELRDLAHDITNHLLTGFADRRSSRRCSTP